MKVKRVTHATHEKPVHVSRPTLYAVDVINSKSAPMFMIEERQVGRARNGKRRLNDDGRESAGQRPYTPHTSGLPSFLPYHKRLCLRVSVAGCGRSAALASGAHSFGSNRPLTFGFFPLVRCQFFRPATLEHCAQHTSRVEDPTFLCPFSPFFLLFLFPPAKHQWAGARLENHRYDTVRRCSSV